MTTTASALLHNSQVDRGATDIYNNTPLMLACNNRMFHISDTLLNDYTPQTNTCNIHEINVDNYSALSIACKQHMPHTAVRIADLAANPQNAAIVGSAAIGGVFRGQPGAIAFYYACYNRYEYAANIIAQHLDYNHIPKIHDIVNTLQVHDHAHGPLVWACKANMPEVARIILDKSPFVDAQDKIYAKKYILTQPQNTQYNYVLAQIE